MKPIDLIAYGLMFLSSVAWGAVLYGGAGLPKIIAILLAIILGPASVILGSVAITKIIDRRKN